MAHHFDGTPIGSEIGIDEHQKHIDDLERRICDQISH